MCIKCRIHGAAGLDPPPPVYLFILFVCMYMCMELFTLPHNIDIEFNFNSNGLIYNYAMYLGAKNIL